MSGDITPIDLKKVAERIGTEWMTLGVHLGVPYHLLQNMSVPPLGGPTQYAARMMNKWHENKARLSMAEVKATIAKALEDAGRMDIARDVRNSPMNNSEEIQKVFQKISPNLTREWRDVGIYLDMSFNELDAIKAPQPLENDPRMMMLEKWHSRTLQNRRKLLVDALVELKRLDIVNEIGGLVAAPSAAPVTTGGSDFFQQPLPSVPTSQPTPVRVQQEATNGRAQPMFVEGTHIIHGPVESLPSQHPVEALPAHVQTTYVQDTSLHSYASHGSVQTSLQYQRAQAARNANPGPPRQDLDSVQNPQSMNQHYSVDGRTVAQPTEGSYREAESLVTNHAPSL